jgi:hypothetical protein
VCALNGESAQGDKHTKLIQKQDTLD